MEKMNVITFKETGHLLGVVTRAGQPEKAATVEEIAAGGFRLRDRQNGEITLQIPEEELGVSWVDYDTRILYRPHLFIMDAGKPEQKTENGPPNLSIALSGALITATLPANVSESVEIWCQIVGNNLSEPIVRSVTIPGTVSAPTNTGSEALILGAGDYKVAMFAPDYALVVFMETVP